ncbi:putative dehydrogenase [Mycobacterium kansasii]|uniref:Putative dehydrogenase n=1 Tax=Mycobacterium kansasii TaxID=1768 RepID=A0A1V3XI99_MYCKA|nr:putative dehydrogenase [Mycobacterium kansasii]
MARQLRRLGVAVLESVAVSQVRWDAVVLSDHTVLTSAVTVWTAGFEVPDLAARSGLRTDALGRLLTDETLTSADDERIVAAGDCAAPSGQPLRMSCQAAGPLGPRPPIPCSAGSRAKPRRCSARRSSGNASASAAPMAPCSCRAPTTLRSTWPWGPNRRRDQGSDLQGHGVVHPARSRQTRLVLLVQRRQAGRTATGRAAGCGEVPMTPR